MKNDNVLVFLNDDETYTSIEGATVRILTDANMEKMDIGEGWKSKQVFELDNPEHLRALAKLLEVSR